MNGFGIVRGLGTAACISLVMAAGGSAIAQQAQTPRPAAPAAPARPAQPAAAASTVVPLKADPNQTNWTKVCGRDPQTQRETCYITRDFVAENDQPVMAVALYETKGEGTKVDRQLRYLLPLTFLLQPGVRTAIDNGQPIAGRYTICVQNGCFAEFAATDAQFQALKKAKALTIQVQNQAAREVSFQLPLDGFAAGVDGPAIDPRVLEEQQRKLQEEMQRRADEMRKQIQPAPGGAAPAPAPGATPAPTAPKP
jgi:invasion protein IalB